MILGLRLLEFICCASDPLLLRDLANIFLLSTNLASPSASGLLSIIRTRTVNVIFQLWQLQYHSFTVTTTRICAVESEGASVLHDDFLKLLVW